MSDRPLTPKEQEALHIRQFFGSIMAVLVLFAVVVIIGYGLRN